jgi:indole-3-glycerol phosphate synthase
MIGVNSRNLKTLEVSIENQEKMLEKLPKEVPIKVAESGIKTKEDILRLINVGFNAFLIGETFMKAENISSKIDELFEDVKID